MKFKSDLANRFLLKFPYYACKQIPYFYEMAEIHNDEVEQFGGFSRKRKSEKVYEKCGFF